MPNFKLMSVNELISRLHDAIESFLAGIENVIDVNSKTGSKDEISTIKEHLAQKLQRGEEVTDNKKLISLLNLLSKDQAILSIIKEDAEEWAEMLNAISDQISSRKPIADEEKRDIKKITAMASEITALIRK
jgi:hypothetical protein